MKENSKFSLKLIFKNENNYFINYILKQKIKMNSNLKFNNETIHSNENNNNNQNLERISALAQKLNILQVCIFFKNFNKAQHDSGKK